MIETTVPEIECPCGFKWLDVGANPTIGLTRTCPECGLELSCIDVDTTWTWAKTRNEAKVKP